MTLNLSHADRTQRVAEDYLRSALIIDDQLRIDRQGATADQPGMPTAADPDPTLEDEPAVVEPSPEELGEKRTGEVDVPALVRAFAARGIACATLPPSASDRELIRKAAKRVDLLIVDWDWETDTEAGALALEVIDQLVEAGGRRVIAVYTQDPDIRTIADKVAARTGAIPGPAVAEMPPRIEFPNLSVIVLSKHLSAVRHIPDGGAAVVDETQLPDRLIAEFATAAGGLLSNGALRGLAAIRDHAPFLLAALNRDLDPGYLVHRIFLEDPGDAEDTARLLVSDELTALLEMSGLEGEVGMDAIESWFAAQPFGSGEYPNAMWNPVFTDTGDPTRREALLSRLRHGVGPNSLHDKRANSLKNSKFLFAADAAAGVRSNQRFAERMAFRARYAPRPRTLGLGTVVEEGGRFYICVQPACDTVRLTKPTVFPLLRMDNVTADSDADLILDDAGDIRRWRIRWRYEWLVLKTFDAERAMVRERMVGDHWHFVDEDETQYRWVGELREAQALRLVNRLAAGFSRVGLDESEWLRQLSENRVPGYEKVVGTEASRSVPAAAPALPDKGAVAALDSAPPKGES